jgi:hypothetical protein
LKYLGIIAFVILLLGGWGIYSIVQEGNQFSSCVKNVAIENCQEKGMEYFSHENIVSMDSFLYQTYECKEIGEDKYLPEDYHEFDFTKSEIEICQK